MVETIDEKRARVPFLLKKVAYSEIGESGLRSEAGRSEPLTYSKRAIGQSGRLSMNREDELASVISSLMRWRFRLIEKEFELDTN